MAVETKTLPDAEDLGAGEELTEEQRKEIEDFKEESWDDEPKEKEPEKKEPEKKEEGKEGEEKPKEEEEETPEEKEKADAEAKKEEEAEAKETARLEKKAEKEGKTVDEIKELESTEKAEQERIEAVAKEEKITIDEVKENEAKDKSVAERHGNDPIKIARALRKEQSEYGKQKSEVEELRDYKAQSEAQRSRFNEREFNSRMESHREEIIDKYREKYPGESTDASNDTVFERGKALIKKGIESKEQASAKEVEEKATEKRAELLKTLPEEFKDQRSEVKEILAECDDLQVLDKGFDAVYLANYARGKKHTPDYIKSLEDAAYKRGAEQAKILPKGGKSPKPTGKKTDNVISGMTSEQKGRAEEVYGNREGWTKEQMWKEYMKDDVKDDF